MVQQAHRLYEFGPYRLDPAQQLLMEGTKKVPLTPKALQTLLVLVENHGQVVTKEELLQKVWPETYVEEATLAQNVFTLRKQLPSDCGGGVYIETIPKRGYRFVAAVRVEEPGIDGPDKNSGDTGPSADQGSRWYLPVSRRSIGISLGGLVILTLIATTSYLWQQQSAHTTRNPRPMLAVLPVQNLTGDSSREYIADGLTEELIAVLGSLGSENLGVIARTSSMTYKHSSKTAGQIGRELGVDYILECSFRNAPGQIRFTAQLIQTRTQVHQWAHNYERPLKDVLELQAELARTVASEIRIRVSPEREKRLAARRPVNPEAYDAYVQGQFHWNERSPQELLLAINYFQQAVAADSEFAPAYAGLADSYAMLSTMRHDSPVVTMPKAKDALLKALALDDSIADAHTSLGWVMEEFDWDWSGAEREFRRALDLDPSDASAHHRYAIHLAAMGKLPQALAEMQAAQRLDPFSPVLMTSTGWVLLRGRMPDQAIRECVNALDLDPKFVRGHLCLGEAYEQKHDLNRAAAEFLQGKMIAGGETPETMDAIKNATLRDGYQGYFQVRLSQLLDKRKQNYVSPYDLADIYVRLGEKAEAMKWLDAAYQEHSPYLVNLQIEPRLDILRSDPRFQALVQRVGLGGLQISKLVPAPSPSASQLQRTAGTTRSDSSK